MVSDEERTRARERAAEMIRGAGVALTPDEASRIEVTDLGLGHIEVEGAQIATLSATSRVAFKVIALFGHQTLPEHLHPVVGGDPGKEETFRVLAGRLCLYSPGKDTLSVGRIPEGKESVYSSRNEIVLGPTDQVTHVPGIRHWLHAPDDGGAVVVSISTCVRDALDEFTDPDVVRIERKPAKS